MNIGAVMENRSMVFVNQLSKTEEISTDFNMEKTQMDELSYYQNLCKQFPDASFRLGDYEESLKHQVWYGYNNHVNQIGDNFGEMGQPSIEIDVAVIRRMQQDPEFEKNVIGLIKSNVNHYNDRMQMVYEDGCMYGCVNIQILDGRLQTSLAGSHGHFSTEEELDEIWGKNSAKNLQSVMIKQYTDKLQRTVMDSLLEMTQSHNKNAYLKVKQ